LRFGLAHGFHAVEFDVMLARDGVPVLIQDPHFGRTIHEAGKVSDAAGLTRRAAELLQWMRAPGDRSRF
jgi:glycerophosphoryl diester phosphodiesterase